MTKNHTKIDSLDIILENAIKERDNFLKENPEMLKYQEELDQEFKLNGDSPMGNMVIIRDRLKGILNGMTKVLSTALDSDMEYSRIMNDRIELRCTNRKCDMSKGFFTSSKFKDDYLNKIDCMECGNKHAEMIRIV